MKRITICIAAALAAALAVGALAGCSGQSSSASTSGSASSEAASASASAEASESAEASGSESATSEQAASGQSTEELVAEFKDVAAKVPAYKSVTITAEESSTSKNSDTGEDESIESTTVYKFDETGDALKTSIEAEISGIKLKYVTDGDAAVIVTDGPIYSGTVEQFDLPSAGGPGAYLDDTIGDLDTLAACAASVEKMESHGLTFYTLTLDPEKYIASDESLKLLADYGSPVIEALVTVGFEEDGSICSIDKKVAYSDVTAVDNLMFSDYGATTVEPLPEADKTYEEMEADMQEKLDAFSSEFDLDDGSEGEEGSTTAEAK